MFSLAFDFAPDRTGPPLVGTRRPFFIDKGIPGAGPGHRLTILDQNWTSNSASASIESSSELNQAITRILCEGKADGTYFLHFSDHGYFSGHGSPKIILAQPNDCVGTSATSGSLLDACLSFPLMGELSWAEIDAVQQSDWGAASVTSGSPAGDLHPPLSLCLRELYERQSVLTEPQAAALERQLQVLLEDEEELQSANISVSVLSLGRLIGFLSEHQTSALPSLSITQAGYFAVSWSPRKRAKLTIVFHPEGEADWIASDLNATPPVYQKDTLANRLGEFAAWANA
jgi:hypothetical protein